VLYENLTVLLQWFAGEVQTLEAANIARLIPVDTRFSKELDVKEAMELAAIEGSRKKAKTGFAGGQKRMSTIRKNTVITISRSPFDKEGPADYINALGSAARPCVGPPFCEDTPGTAGYVRGVAKNGQQIWGSPFR
jgi:hypothetical protein